MTDHDQHRARFVVLPAPSVELRDERCQFEVTPQEFVDLMQLRKTLERLSEKYPSGPRRILPPLPMPEESK
jgi:hypothetical protein